MAIRQIWIISMHSKTELYACRVCGYEQLEPPWGEDGQSPTYEICSCCGVEFGYEDSTKTSMKKFRDNWVAAGMQWSEKKQKPDSWDCDLQFKNIPKEYL